MHYSHSPVRPPYPPQLPPSTQHFSPCFFSTLFFSFFFFSSRRRHTRLQGDWSSDVCSSDLDLVVLHVHSTRGDGSPGRAIVDIFRLENGKVVEHWDVIQDIPEKAANANGMF